ncbi:MAG: geranylgeranyl reductase family protein [archaeon]|nr:geranylgeranyl reductase family protein [archaeon]
MNLVTIVGAGPVGLKAAIDLQSEGWHTVVLEEDKAVGEPENCSGLISVSGLKLAGVTASGVITNEIFGARIFSPNKKHVLEIKKSSPVAVVVNRTKFDQKIAREAEKKGVEIKHNCRLINVNGETLFVQKEGHGEIIKSRIVLGADGVNSKVREIMGTKVPKENYIHSIQVKATGDFDQKLVEMYFNEEAKDFFAWVIPEGNGSAKIGLGTRLGLNPKQALDKFIERDLADKNVQVKSLASFLIPVSKPLDQIVKGNLLIAGDAAHQVKATTGGGLVTGIIAGRLAAKAVSNHLKHKTSLDEYKKHVQKLNKELELHYKIRKYFNSLSLQQVDDLMLKLKKAKIEEFLEKHGDMDRPTLFVNKFISNPSHWGLLPTGLKLLMS